MTTAKGKSPKCPSVMDPRRGDLEEFGRNTVMYSLLIIALFSLVGEFSRLLEKSAFNSSLLILI